MISAKEAAELYEEHRRNSMDKQLKDVENLIKNSIEKYESRCVSYYKPLSYDTISYLHSLGYKVNIKNDPRDGDYYDIEF
jgi:hypothetical protein